MGPADRIILGALAAGVWAVALICATSTPTAIADTDPQYGPEISVFQVHGLRRFVVRTIEACATTADRRILCDGAAASNNH